MERKLASVQRVLALRPIENADAIELAQINGWQCVVKKGEFAVGALGVFFEIDAIPPELPQLAFLWTSRNATEPQPRPESFRIKTMRLRGTLSQGLLMPLAQFVLPENLSEGDDLTAFLSVGKWEPPVPSGMGDFRGPFPPLVRKTDEMRVQSVPCVLDELRGLPYVITLKCDGTSATYCIDPRTDEFHACGRNQSILEDANHYWNLAKKYEIEAALRKFPHLAVQGEICGPGIQTNRLGLKTLEFFVFNVYDQQQGKYLSHDDARAFLAEANLPAVTVLEEGEAFAHTQDSLLALAEGKYDGTQNEREGIVIRPKSERNSLLLAGRLSFKVISNRFLLKEGE
ncbi:RNA ligase (ATP) [Armatimonas sp.]|uniref:RNA ligase (ATP) n=1 Tax=Armatimonas sp. TaxID=1872638 RepID=UPI00286D39A8|nr:RNA ligase (ATP) [Armatimonas sp.]